MAGVRTGAQENLGWPVWVVQGKVAQKVHRGWLVDTEPELSWVAVDRPDAKPQALPHDEVDLATRYFVLLDVPLSRDLAVTGVLTDSAGNSLYKDFTPFSNKEIARIMGLFGDELKARCQAFSPKIFKTNLRWVRIVGRIGVLVTQKWTPELLNAVFARQGYEG